MRRFSLRRFSLRRFSLRSLRIHCGAFTAEPSLRTLTADLQRGNCPSRLPYKGIPPPPQLQSSSCTHAPVNHSQYPTSYRIPVARHVFGVHHHSIIPSLSAVVWTFVDQIGVPFIGINTARFSQCESKSRAASYINQYWLSFNSHHSFVVKWPYGTRTGVERPCNLLLTHDTFVVDAG